VSFSPHPTLFEWDSAPWSSLVPTSVPPPHPNRVCSHVGAERSSRRKFSLSPVFDTLRKVVGSFQPLDHKNPCVDLRISLTGNFFPPTLTPPIQLICRYLRVCFGFSVCPPSYSKAPVLSWGWMPPLDFGPTGPAALSFPTPSFAAIVTPSFLFFLTQSV